ncbi:MAG: polysaccharide deacetylase family protein [Verrucomicrobiales bacterium]
MNAPSANLPAVPRPWTRLVLLHALPLLAGAPWGTTGLAIAFGVIAVVMIRSIAFPHGWFFGRARRSFPATGKKMLYLTIDDGPTDDTPAMLEVLESHQAKACFFLIGDRAAASPDLARAITEAGHQIGNHTRSHPATTFWAMPPSAQRREIREGNQMIAATSGQSPRWFRAPVGLLGPFLPALVREQGLGLLGWNARGFDTRRRDPESIVRAILAGLMPGSIILLHQGHAHSVATLELLIKRCREDGWEFSLLPE